MRTLSLVICGLSLTLPVTAAADQPFYYLEKDGVVAFEVEGEIADGWTLNTTVEGYTGTGFLEWTGPDRLHHKQAGEGEMSYGFRIATPGNYEVRWRSRIMVADETTEHNDSWLKLPTGENVPDEQPLENWFKVYMNSPNSWSWNTHTVDHESRKVRQFFGVGDHVLGISGRSSGHAIDRVILYRYEGVDFDAGRFERMPPSETTSEPFAGETDSADSADGAEGAEGAEGADGTGGTSGDEAAGGGSGDGSIDAGTEETPPYPVTDVSEHPPGECLASRLVLAPSEDAYVGDGDIRGGESLRIDGGARRALIAYEIDALPSPEAAELQFTVDENEGRGTLRAYLASHTDWRSGEGEERAPDSIVELGTVSGSWSAGTRYAMPLDASLLPASATAVTLVLELDAGGEGVTFASSEVAGSGPLLLIEGNATFCTDRDLAREADGTNTDGASTNGSDGAGEGEDAGAEEGSAGGEPVDGDGTADGGEPSGGGDTGAGPNEEGKSGGEDSGSANKTISGGGAGGALPFLVPPVLWSRRTVALRARRSNLDRGRD